MFRKNKTMVITIKVPKFLYEELKMRARNEGIRSVEEYVRRIIEKTIEKKATDEEKIKERLRALGYLR